ncbi:MAG: DNA mismatch repair endonuclease MutL [Bacteroidales bacterium]|nr:DNA mismatch repair endonuclease MutL [Bacteroidales bacterium]
MSDVIHLLPDSVANQIAAGEVIQRPASVIKELVENSIDAGASSIQIRVKDAGRTSIQVIDNGMGMSSTDARLSFERHATSKISSAADIYSLHTMGFRGEALASIAAVAQVELKTRRADDELGTSILMTGSVIEKQETISTPVGSSFTVKNLFFNVPARRKFLKSNDVELRHIISEFERIVLVHPDISFSLFHNDAELYQLPESSLKQRILHTHKSAFNSFSQQLLTIHAETTLGTIDGFVGDPQAARKRNAIQFLFVNGRYMRHPYFHKAILSCYEQLIPSGEMPNYFLYFTVDPSSIDINVHPTKTEIKFENEAILWKILTAAVKEALGKSSAVPSIDFDQEDAPEIPILTTTDEIKPPTIDYNPSYNPFKGSGGYSASYSASKPTTGWETLYSRFENSELVPPSEQTTEVDYAMDSIGPQPILPEQRGQFFSSGEMTQSASFLPFKGHYLMTSVKSGLMIIDQRRAHIRILFDVYMSSLRNKQGFSQRLLFPEQMDLSVSDAIVLSEIWDDLQFMGFEINELGENAYSINAVPSGIEGMNPVALIQQMIHSAISSGDDLKESVEERIALSLARSTAIPYGQALSAEEVQKLIDDLFRTNSPGYTPDGKKILHILSNEEIDKLFKL